MTHCLYCIAKTDGHAIRLATRLREAGVDPGDISIVTPDPTARRDLAHTNATKAPEGAATGATAGALVGGAVAWLVGIGSLPVPGGATWIAVGPVFSALAGLAVGGTLGGLGGALLGMRFPEYEAQQYEGKLQRGRILISVHAGTKTCEARIRRVLVAEQAEDISTGSEMAVPHR